MTQAEIFLKQLTEKLKGHFQARIVDRPDMWRTKQLQMWCECLMKDGRRFVREEACVCLCHGEANTDYFQLLFDGLFEVPDLRSLDFVDFYARALAHVDAYEKANG